jgi:hypothetical protein
MQLLIIYLVKILCVCMCVCVCVCFGGKGVVACMCGCVRVRMFLCVWMCACLCVGGWIGGARRLLPVLQKLAMGPYAETIYSSPFLWRNFLKIRLGARLILAPTYILRFSDQSCANNCHLIRAYYISCPSPFSNLNGQSSSFLLTHLKSPL